MKKRIAIMLSVLFLLFTVGNAGAQQVLLPGMKIPKFVEPLPLLEFEFINATSLTLPGLLGPLGPGLNTASFPVNAEEFRAQILPAAANPRR